MVDSPANERSPFLMSKSAQDPTTKKKGYAAAAFTVVLSVLLLTTFSAVQYYFSSGGGGGGAVDVRASLVSSDTFGKSSTTDGGDPYCNDANAHADTSFLSQKLNDALDANAADGGFIFRDRFDGQIACSWTNYKGECLEDNARSNCNNDGSACGVAATFLTNQVITPNPTYCLSNGCDKPTVGYALLDSWKNGDLGGYAYYATDSNSVDGRDWQINGTPGRGCHTYKYKKQIFKDQNYLCGTIDNDPYHCVTYDSASSYYCKCDYDHFDPDYFGDYVFKEYGSPQPSFIQDQTACWIEEGDDMNVLVKIQNSLYLKKDEWWNGANGSMDGPINNDPATWQYQGWNEVAFNADIDYRDNQDKLEALIVVLPTGYEGLCDFDHDDVQFVDELLYKYWLDGYGTTPVVIMKSTNKNGDGYTYQKEIFVQSFQFANGNCIKDDGFGILKYYGKGC